MRKPASVFIPSTARRYTLPPRPPSPPSGPPNGTNFSRRKLTQPRPPLPAWTLTFASSVNFMWGGPGIKRGSRFGLAPPRCDSEHAPAAALLFRDDADVGALL